MNSKPGTYVIMLRCDAERHLQVGRWGSLDVQPGYYLYVGSAFGPGGLLARVARHCRGSVRKHWHIDYLREAASPVYAWYSHSAQRLEHRWASALGKLRWTTPIEGFGCTDCQCETHLFFSASEPDLAAFARRARCKVSSIDCAALA